MKRSFPALLVIGLLISASFGFFVMNHMAGHGHMECPFGAVGVSDCARVRDPLDFAFSHLGALTKFFSAIPASSFAGLLTFALFIFSNKDPELFQLKPAFIRSRLHESFVSLGKIEWSRWYALHENSPSLPEGR